MFIDTLLDARSYLVGVATLAVSKATTAKIVDYLLGHDVLTKIQRERRLGLRA